MRMLNIIGRMKYYYCSPPWWSRRWSSHPSWTYWRSRCGTSPGRQDWSSPSWKVWRLVWSKPRWRGSSWSSRSSWTESAGERTQSRSQDLMLLTYKGPTLITNEAHVNQGQGVRPFVVPAREILRVKYHKIAYILPFQLTNPLKDFSKRFLLVGKLLSQNWECLVKLYFI